MRKRCAWDWNSVLHYVPWASRQHKQIQTTAVVVLQIDHPTKSQDWLLVGAGRRLDKTFWSADTFKNAPKTLRSRFQLRALFHSLKLMNHSVFAILQSSDQDNYSMGCEDILFHKLFSISSLLRKASDQMSLNFDSLAVKQKATKLSLNGKVIWLEISIWIQKLISVPTNKLETWTAWIKKYKSLMDATKNLNRNPCM